MEWIYIWFLLGCVAVGVLFKFLGKYQVKVTVWTGFIGGLLAVLFNTIITNFSWDVVKSLWWPMFMTGFMIAFLSNTMARMITHD